jgi:hypothetical protein
MIFGVKISNVLASKTKTAQCMMSFAVGLALKPGAFGVICIVG